MATAKEGTFSVILHKIREVHPVPNPGIIWNSDNKTRWELVSMNAEMVPHI